jgi:hypothetical protein
MLGSSPLGSSPLGSVYFSNGQLVVVVPTEVGRPNGVVSNTGWLPSVASEPLDTMLDEAVVDDGDYIYSANVGDVCRISLGPMINPGNLFTYRMNSSMGNGVVVRLYSDETIVCTWSHMLTPEMFDYARPLSQAQRGMLTGNISYSITTT